MPDGITSKSSPSAPAVESITVHGNTAACDGGGGALGHPRVFLTLKNGEATCPYCSRHYVSDGKTGGGH